MTTKAACDTSVLIVGAGPAGLVLACELARRGVDFRLAELRPGPLIASRGKGLQPRSLEVFEDLDVLPAILDASGSYPPMRFTKGGETVMERRLNVEVDATPDVPYPNLLMVPQWRTEEILRARLGELGGKVEYGLALRDFTQDDAAVTATLDGPGGAQEVRAKYLVGTDGGRSTVRATLDLDFPGKVLEGPRFLFGDIEIEGLTRDVWSMWPGDEGVLGLCPLPHVSAFQLMAALTTDDDPVLSTESVGDLIQRRTGRPDLRVQSTGWLSVFTPNLRLAERYRVGRVFLAGDAAHVHPPTGGQGLNTSIQDAYNLGWKLALALDGAAPSLLDTYEAERRPIAIGMLELSGGLAGQPVGSQTRGREAQQLDLSYRGSPLAPCAPGGDRSLAAGDRAPDAPYTDRNGRQRRIFESLRGPHFTLLLFGDVPEPEGLGRWPVDVVRLPAGPGGAAATYGVERHASVLIRPDNYIGQLDLEPTASTPARWFTDRIGT